MQFFFLSEMEKEEKTSWKFVFVTDSDVDKKLFEGEENA